MINIKFQSVGIKLASNLYNNMKKIYFLLFVSFAISSIQSQGFEYGIVWGINLSSSGNLTKLTSELTSFDQAKNAVNGFNLGLYGQLKIAMLYLRPELHFSKFETSYDALSVGKTRIEAPVSVGFKLLPLISAFAGPTYRYDLSENTDSFTVESVQGESTLGLHFGARVHLGKLGLEARIERGITDNEAQILSDKNVNIGVIDERAPLLSLGFSYAF